MDCDDETGPKGFRAKWHRTRPPAEASSSSAVIHDADDCLDEYVHDLQKYFEQLGPPISSEYAPTTPEAPLEPVDDDVIVDLGGLTSTADDDALISDTFVRGVKRAGLVMPWETPLMSQIFGDAIARPSLAMPMEWGLPPVSATKPKMPSSCKWSCTKHIKYTTDDNYLVQRSRTMKTAIAKWRFIVLLDYQQSEVGRQIATQADEELILQSVIGVKSVNTVLKRANSILMHFRWHAAHGQGFFIPFNEQDVWHYVLSQNHEKNSATRSQSFLQALRFSHFVMGIEGALECAQSRRVTGQAHLQLSRKQPTKQARPLSVAEVRKLHSNSEDHSYSCVDRCIASNLLMATYGRCRVSDLNHVHEILRDASGKTGFAEISTRHRKGARSAQQKALLMPIVISNAGVVPQGWIHVWIANRNSSGLQTSGEIGGAFMPAPAISDKVEWLKRPLTPSEMTNVLRGCLDSIDSDLSSHSLKATNIGSSQ